MSDRLQYEMSNGTKHEQAVPAGEIGNAIASISGQEWIRVDDTTLIRADQVICVRLFTADDGPMVQ